MRFLLIALTALFAISAPAAPRTKRKAAKPTTTTQSATDMRRRQAETQQDITRTRQEIRKNDADVKKGLSELSKLRSDIDAGRKLVDEASHQVETLSASITNLETQIATEEQQLTQLRTDYLRSLKKIRAHRGSSSSLAFIFSSNSFRQASQRMRYLRRLSSWKQQRTQEIASRKEALQQSKNSLSSSKIEKDRALNQQLTAQNTLRTKYEQQDRVVADLRKNGKELRTHLAQKQQEANALKSRIAALIAADQKKQAATPKPKPEPTKPKGDMASKTQPESGKQKGEVVSTTRPESGRQKGEATPKPRPESSKQKGNAVPAPRNPETENLAATPQPEPSRQSNSSFASMRGSLPRPVAGSFRVTSRFGRNSLPEFPDVVYDNPGIDVQVASGATAKAVYPGKVSGVYMLPGYSTVVIINHNGYYTVYGNIATASVSVGQEVSQGAALGRLAADADNPSFSSLHFEVWRNRDKLNPLDWIR